MPIPEFALPEYSNEAQPAFSDSAACTAWLAELPLVNVAPAQLRLLEQVHALNRHDLAPELRLQLLEMLREPVCFVQAEQIKKLASKPLPLTQIESGIFGSVAKLWQEMLLGYKRCLVAAGDSGIKNKTALICARALDSVAANMYDHCIIRCEWPQEAWLDLHHIYRVADQAGETVTPVSDPARPGDACCAEIYVRALLFALANPSELGARQIAQVQRWLGDWGQYVPVRNLPAAPGELPALLLDFSSASGAYREADTRGRNASAWLDIGELARTLKRLVVLLRKGEAPAALGLGDDCSMPAVEQQLIQLFRLWCEGKNARAQTRRTTSAKAHVCSTIAATHYHVSGGRHFRQPGHSTELSRRERDEIATFGRASSRHDDAFVESGGHAIEEWTLEEESLSGLRIVRAPGTAGARYYALQLVAVRPADAKTFLVGMIRWLKTDQEGRLHAGIRVIPGMPQPIAVRATGVNAIKEKFVPALYCPALAALSVPASLILPPGWFRAKRVIEVYSERSELLQLGALIERGSDFERVAFEAAENVKTG